MEREGSFKVRYLLSPWCFEVVVNSLESPNQRIRPMNPGVHFGEPRITKNPRPRRCAILVCGVCLAQ